MTLGGQGPQSWPVEFSKSIGNLTNDDCDVRDDTWCKKIRIDMSFHLSSQLPNLSSLFTIQALHCLPSAIRDLRLTRKRSLQDILTNERTEKKEETEERWQSIMHWHAMENFLSEEVQSQSITNVLRRRKGEKEM